MVLYHGGSSNNPKVSSQKELGIQCSPNPLEGNLHFRTRLVKCYADVSGAIEVDDMNNWGSLEAFIAVLENAGVEDGRQIATRIWRANNCRTNTLEASAVMRDTMLDYGITCVKFIDTHDEKVIGSECYILLTDHKFHVVDDLAEGFPNLYLANAYLPESNQIEIVIDYRPYFAMDGSYHLVPKNLFLEDPEYIADYLLRLIESNNLDVMTASQKIQELAERIQDDFNCDVDVNKDNLLVCIKDDSWLNRANPKIAVKGKVTSLDKRYNRLTVPVNSIVDDVYYKKVKSFIESFL